MPRYQTYGQYDAKNDEFPDSAEKVLRAGEDAAAGDFGDAERYNDSSDDSERGLYRKNGAGEDGTNYNTAREANEREGLYRGGGLAASLNGVRGKSKGGNFFKRRAPLIAIILMITGLGVGIGMSQTLMPFHVVESLTEMTDGSFTARASRMPYLAKWLFNMESQTYSTGTRYRNSINSTKIKTRLAAEGIDVETSGGKTVLNYHQSDGTVRTVSADEYTELWNTDVEFRNKMSRGGRSFLGRIAAHIDLTLANFLNQHSLTKNLFKNWINKVYEAEGQTANLNRIIKARAPDSTGDFDAAKGRADGGNGTEIGKVEVDGDSEQAVKVQTDADLRGKYAEMLSNVASVTTSLTCGAAAVASAAVAAKLVIAHENARGTFSPIGEASDKGRTKNGDTSPINEVSTELMRKDENGLTALQSETMKTAISGGIYTPNLLAADVTENSQSAMLKGDGFWSDLWTGFGEIGSSAAWTTACAAANVATAAVSIVASLATLGTFSFGKAALGIVISATMAGAVSKLAEYLVTNATTNFCLDTVGVKRGACIYLGAANYNGLNFQNGGGSLATKEKATPFYQSYKIALAEEDELIRSTKSPFDATSSHTFLGSIVSKFSLIAAEMPSLSSMASGLVSIASTSLNSLLPTASAIDETVYFDTHVRDDCANLDFGDYVALGDMNCEPWYITDQSMRSSDPEATFNFLMQRGQFKTNSDGSLAIDPTTGKEIIDEKSDLAKYISYCALRSSPFGSVDQNIMNAESEFLGKNTGSKIKQFLSLLPIVGDFVQAIEGVTTINSLGWSTGANCVARGTAYDTQLSGRNIDDVGESSDPVKLVSWDTFMKYAQSYVADDRYMQTAEDDYKSPVISFATGQGLLEPDDDLSFVEYLAKYSGYTVENMQIALNEIEYWAYIAQYEPEGKGPMKFEDDSPEIYDFSEPEVLPDDVEYVASGRVIYSDERNRFVAMA